VLPASGAKNNQISLACLLVKIRCDCQPGSLRSCSFKIASHNAVCFSCCVRKNNVKKQQTKICVASAAVRNKTGNFEFMDGAEDMPRRACLKAFHEGIPVPVAERE
jgi:hypothetical protein